MVLMYPDIQESITIMTRNVAADRRVSVKSPHLEPQARRHENTENGRSLETVKCPHLTVTYIR